MKSKLKDLIYMDGKMFFICTAGDEADQCNIKILIHSICNHDTAKSLINWKFLFWIDVNMDLW